LEDRKQQLLYDRPSIKEYLQHCRTKSARVVAAETEQTLIARCGFRRREFYHAELHVCSIRHISHHAAQLSLRLKIDIGQGAPWVGSGWRDA
jgi:hypothetical protein